MGVVGTESSSVIRAIPRSRILLIEDEPMMQRTIQRILLAEHYTIETYGDAESAIVAFEKETPDVVLLDCMLPGIDGHSALKRLRGIAPEVPVVMMTGSGRIDLAVRAMREGAYDFIAKPFESSELLVHAMARALEHQALRRRARELQKQLASTTTLDLIGRSKQMQDVHQFIHSVASSRATVLVLGESGTGKELVARAIHRSSLNAHKPFVCVNCAAIPGELIESELFGHVRGAFTGAHNHRAGLFESANGGTIFLDEIGDLPLPAQAHLLRTLQEGEIRPVGSDTVKHVDVRVVAATNAPLEAKIKAGTFRQDLFYRLNVLSLRIPPLRDRGEDIAFLAHWFLERDASRSKRAALRLDSGAIERLMSYSWPGNVRELENAIERAVVFAQGDVLSATDLPSDIGASDGRIVAAASTRDGASNIVSFSASDPGSHIAYSEAKRHALVAFETSYVDALLKQANGNLAEAARLAKLDRSNFRRLVKRARDSARGIECDEEDDSPPSSSS